MSEPCTHSQLVTPSIGIILRQSASCPRCGQPLKSRPDANLAASLIALGGGTVLGSMFDRGTWSAAAATFACIIVLYVTLGFGMVRFLPMRHLQTADAAASNYRVLIGLMLILCVLVLALAYGTRQGA